MRDTSLRRNTACICLSGCPASSKGWSFAASCPKLCCSCVLSVCCVCAVPIPIVAACVFVCFQQVDPERNLLYVRGQVPGPQGSFVMVRDAFRWRWPERQAAGLPFPTHIGELPPVAVAKRDGGDPYRVSLECVCLGVGHADTAAFCRAAVWLQCPACESGCCLPVVASLSRHQQNANVLLSFIRSFILRRCTARTLATLRPTGRVTERHKRLPELIVVWHSAVVWGGAVGL